MAVFCEAATQGARLSEQGKTHFKTPKQDCLPLAVGSIYIVGGRPGLFKEKEEKNRY